MKFRKILLISMAALMFGQGSPVRADERGAVTHVVSLNDAVGFAVGILAREWYRHTENLHYDIKQGIKKIKENIGMFKSEGKCGVSATGNTGCDLITEEEGAELAAKAEEEAMALDQTTIKIIEENEAGIEDTSVDGVAKNKKGDLFDKVRANVEGYIFTNNSEAVNADCTCNKGKGKKCSPNECARTRQNDALVQASTAASATADTYLRNVDKNYDVISKAVNDINGTSTVADFVGKTGQLSVDGASFVADLMLLQAYDLRAQSYHGLASLGIDKVDLSKLKREDSKK